ncbi:hypothetical protein TRFO_35000 [Tritrichomonas foetus]|uniref:Uncharacterized protein n=1 Tax=Tritrichomonas foetus TaxID=1144522 RepID=A0A1J4JHH5_9EUKA|nr:hypothetical protein TRFO_35000 [Tritrichomonas foetus]|eukprot:OHS98600.1 hypothetical protein TRFO_35000 [Tritrichomonas foetus]
MTVASNQLYVVTNEAYLMKLKPKQIILDSSLQIPFGVGKCVAVFPKLKLIVVTSPSGDAFHTFSIESTSLFHIFSFRQQFSSLNSLTNAGKSMLVVLSQDGSLTVWDFSPSSNSFNDPLYKVNHHLVSAVDATASEDLRLVVSCDISRRIVLTELYEGTFIRSFYLPDESSVPVKVMILDAGYIVSFCEHRSHNDIRSTIHINALDSDTLGIYDHPRRVTSCCPINLHSGMSFIAVGFEDGSFFILATPDANAVHTTLFPSPVIAISYQKGENLLFLANSERQIFSLVLDL